MTKKTLAHVLNRQEIKLIRMLEVIHPHDVAFAFLVPLAISNPRIAGWLSKASLNEKPQTFKDLIQLYLKDPGASEIDMYELEEKFRVACTNLSAFEESIENLEDYLCDPEEIANDFNRVMGEERFGLLIRNVTRIVNNDNFEDVCRLYDESLQFFEGQRQNNHDLEEAIEMSTNGDTKKTHTIHQFEGEDFASGLQRLEVRKTIESLHKYFDHASRKMSALLPPTHPFAETLRTEGFPNRKAVFLQHAILELATIHHQLGNDHEAFLAAREAVCVAQQNLDEIRLEASLNLFRRLDGNLPLSYSRTDRGKLERAQHLLFGDEPVHRMPGRRADIYSSFSRPKQIWQELDDIHDSSLQNRKALMRSDAWEQFGHAALAKVWTSSVISDKFVSAEDKAIALCRLGYINFFCGNSEGNELLSSMKQSFEHQVDPFEVILSIYETKNYIHPSDVTRVTETILNLAHLSLLMKGKFILARKVFNLAETSGCFEKNQFLLFDQQFHYNCYGKAFQLLISSVNNNGGRKIHEADAFLRASRLFHKERALLLSLKALSLGKELNLRTLCATASCEVARARMELGQVDEALALIRKSLPQIAAHSPLVDLKRVQLLEIKCNLKKTQDYEHVIQKLESFIQNFPKNCDYELLKEAYYLSSRCYHCLGKFHQSDVQAEHFLALLNKREDLIPDAAENHAKKAMELAANQTNQS